MLQRALVITGVALLLTATQLTAQEKAVTGAVTCDDLNWSASVLEQNPDISQSCRGVYEKYGKLYALAQIEIVRVRGNTMTFRTLHVDGGKGNSRSVTLDPLFRARIAGVEYRINELMRGQVLNVYLPEDRFALAVEDRDGPDVVDFADVVEAATVDEVAEGAEVTKVEEAEEVPTVAEEVPTVVDIGQAKEAVKMPATASPLFLFAISGAALFGLGGLFTALRRRWS